MQSIFFQIRSYTPALEYPMFRKKITVGENAVRVVKTAIENVDYSRIRCPKCLWQPTAASRWFCADAGLPEFYFGGCGAMWNTFATGGVCVGCKHRWRWTTCLRCAEWSRHEDWYAEKSV